MNCQSGLQWTAYQLISAVGADFLPPTCNTLQSTLANCRFLQPTLTRIAEDCGKANHYISIAPAGALEHAQSMAAHESPRTTKLYDRTKERLTQDEVERIRL